MQDLYTENYKISMWEIQEDLMLNEKIFMSWIRRLNVVKSQIFLILPIESM